ncbi:MAG: PfkB family carbohydrate kinase [Minicystis sp.]
MRRGTQPVLGAPMARSFDVICAGEALSHLAATGGGIARDAASLRLRPGGGAVNAALALARQGLRVGLATAIGDDSFGRALFDRIAEAGVDVGGVALVPRAGLVFVQGDAGRVVCYREEAPPLAVPAAWSARVLLLSGLSPAVAYGATICKAARAARRAGTIVVIDVNARWHLWAGHDPRAIQSVLREADVVRCSAQDLAALGVDAATVRAALRPDAVLVTSNAAGSAWASGPFGEVAPAPGTAGALRATGSGDVFTAAICAELARAGHPGEARPELWDRALQRGHAAASAQRRQQ